MLRVQLMRKEAELTRAEEIIKREQQQNQEMRQQVSLVTVHAVLLTLFRHTACSTNVSICSNSKQVKYTTTAVYGKFLNRQFLHYLFLLQTIYLKIDKRAQLYLNIKRLFLSCA